jgi:hypothetical protein
MISGMKTKHLHAGSRILAFAAALTFAAAAMPAGAQDENYGEGVFAYNKGRFEQAISSLQPLIEKGHAGAELITGVMFLRGEGYPKDEGLAAIWLFKAARKGEAGAQLILGTQFLYGRGVGLDVARAYTWLALAAESSVPIVAQQANLYRDEAAGQLSAAEIEAAQRAAQSWRPVRDRFVPEDTD